MDKNICRRCLTENEPEYTYCKNCGAPLTCEPESQPKNDYYSGQAYTHQHYTQQTYTQTPPPSQTNEYTAESDTIDGIPMADIATFVGKKSNVIIPKFVRLQILGSKSAWCWPAAIWSFIMGPIGAAFWFIYRKMYKHAIIFALIAIVMSAVTYTVLPPTESVFNVNIEAADSVASLYEIFGGSTQLTLVDYVLSWVNTAVSMVTAIVSGIYGWHWYKQHAVDKIYSYRASNPDNKYYQFALCSMGGTSMGLAILLFFMFSMADTAIGEILARVLGGI